MQVRYVGVSNESAYGVMRFVSTAEQLGLPKIVSIQNSYSLLVCLEACFGSNRRVHQIFDLFDQEVQAVRAFHAGGITI